MLGKARPLPAGPGCGRLLQGQQQKCPQPIMTKLRVVTMYKIL